MDPRLLNYYNDELAYLRELGAEFAKQYPKVAARLGMCGTEVTDPYVERLLEGFCFLTARIHLKMDAEFPRFSQRLLEVVYPNYLSPTPAMCIVQFTPGEMGGNHENGFVVARGTRLKEPLRAERRTQCEFRTAHTVELWPLTLASARFEGAPADVRLARLQLDRPIRSTLHLRLDFTSAHGGQAPGLDRLSLHLRNSGQLASHLYELLCGHTLGIAVRPTDSGEWTLLPASSLQPEGLSEDESLLPYSPRGFQGYRLLHEYFAMPARYHFIAIDGLAKALAGSRDASGFEILILLDRNASEYETLIGPEHFALFCTPAVNLIDMRSDRVPVAGNRHEFHVVPDRARPMDYEVYSVALAEGFGQDNTVEAEFRPFYTCVAQDRGEHGSYFSVRREPRRPSDSSRRHGARTTYIGSEVFLSLVDRKEAPYSGTLRQLGVEMTVSNRDLPMLMSIGSNQDLIPLGSLPVSAVRIIEGPTKPQPAAPEGELTWRLISQLGLGYQTLTDLTPEQGAEALRELLTLYAALGDAAVARQARGLLGASLKPVTRRLPGYGPLTFGRGVAIDLTVDETQFAGGSAYLFGTVMERFLARHVGLNTFIEVSLSSAQRGRIGQWAPRFGTRPTV
ncbi:type VI secretion system baseplate subunit TssF [Pseudomonas sp. PDM16]|uniref:type VI secretion system baseplate subunit TssF n=1 Tax=Pseudomonas sp. PDM16 TaxID=2769292 RepID=UPI00177FF9E5|nr:type VI secretion system baseplate subunit TssF [Pseudomonas sp. PDM16]MBD9415848.1 type VI secretion system baseplate subunit TssF [Pseudomonas sp. PDM16]